MVIQEANLERNVLLGLLVFPVAHCSRKSTHLRRAGWLSIVGTIF